MNLVRNPLKILSPWWYYVETSLVAQIVPVLILMGAFVGKLEDTYPAWINGGDFTGWFWPGFLIHVGTSTLMGLLMIYHDMIAHPEMFREVTKWHG